MSNTATALLPCVCGGKVGSRAAVKFHPQLNILEGIIRYSVRCARCKKIITTKDKRGFISYKTALRTWNNTQIL